jgi:hypothetical protein
MKKAFYYSLVCFLSFAVCSCGTESEGDARLIESRGSLLNEISDNTVAYGNGLFNGDRWWGYTRGAFYNLGGVYYRGSTYRAAGFLVDSLAGP